MLALASVSFAPPVFVKKALPSIIELNVALPAIVEPIVASRLVVMIPPVIVSVPPFSV